MFRSNNRKPMLEYINFLLNHGAMGDMTGALPVLKYVVDNCPNIKPFVWVPEYYKEFAQTALPNVPVEGFSSWKTNANKSYALAQTITSSITSLACHTTDHAFLALIDKQVDDQYKNSIKMDTSEVDLTKFNLPEKYVVVTTGYTSKTREWPENEINKVVDWIVSVGITPVFLGSDKPIKALETNASDYKGHFASQIIYNKGLNLINATTLIEACAIMGKAMSVVGVDNGLLHVAACTDVHIVGGFTTVEPKHRLPYRNNVIGYNFDLVLPEESLSCRFCQSSWSHVYNHDFKECFYRDYECTKQMKAESFISLLQKKHGL